MSIFRNILFLLMLVSFGCQEKSIHQPTDEEQLNWQSISGRVVELSSVNPPAVFPSPGFVTVKAGTPEKIPLNTEHTLSLQPRSNQFRQADESAKRHTDIDKDVISDAEEVFTLMPNVIQPLLPDVIDAKDPITKTPNPFSFSFYTRIQGLPHDDISVIEFDHKGNLWIGTYGAGIIRHDGTNFYQYTTDHGLPDNFISSLMADSKGRIIIGTRIGGMVIFDGINFKIYSEKEGFPRNRIEALYEDTNGDLWIGTYGAGIIKYDGNGFTWYETVDGISGYIVYSITEDPNGNLWFGTRGDGILIYNGETFERITTENGLPDNYIVSLCIDKVGNIWIGTDGGGLVSFDGGNFQIFDKSVGFPDNNITVVFEDSFGRIWAGTREAGLLYYDGEKFLQFKDREGLINNFITAIKQDNGNQLWIGTYGGGIGTYFGNVFRHYNEYDGIPVAFLRAILEDSKGNLWLGMNTQGLLNFKNDHLLHFTKWHGLADDRIRTIFEDSKGNIWIGFLYNSLSVYDGKKFNSFADHPILRDIAVTSVLETNDGAIWLGTHGDGMFKLYQDEVTHFKKENGLSCVFIRKLVADEDNNLWIASRDGGICKFNGTNFVHYTTHEGLPTDDFFDILIDNNGGLWAGTNGSGIIRYKDGRFVNFTEKHGLGSNFVYSVLEDHNEDIWFGTRWGLSLFLGRGTNRSGSSNDNHIAHAHASGIFLKNYSWSDGFHGVGVNSRAMFQHSNGTIWIGANDLITTFQPGETVPDTLPPYLYLTSLGLYNETIPWKNLYHNQDTVLFLTNGMRVSNFSFSDVNPWYGIPSDLNLSNKNNYLVFSFAAVSSRYQELTRYQYYLEGLEQTWGAFTTRPEANYGNLRPGRYTFRARAMNSAGYFSEDLSYSFRINHPWYLKWWAFGIYIFLLTLIVMGIITYRRQLRKRKEQQKQEELLLQQQVEIAQKAAEFKQNFLANMSHEIRTPLTGILGMAELLSKTHLDETQEDYLKTLILSGENLRETINLVLDYSKIEAGKVKLNNEIFSFHELFERVEKLFISICRKDILLEKYISEDLPGFVKSDYNRILQIVNNLISNAVKFTEKGKVAIRAEAIEGEKLKGRECMVKISVSDTGKGINKSELSSIFKPFYQAEQTYDRSSDGTGLGLAICKELSGILGGEIGFDSESGSGSTFWFTFKCTVEDAPAKVTEGQKTDETLNHRLRILLVEDKLVNQKVINLMLKSMKHQVTLAENGQKALDVFKPGKFDLILMDIQMPVMDGIAATSNLRKKYAKFLPPIVGLSANAFEGDRERYMESGLDEYLTKPVKQKDFEQLIEKLKL